MEPKQFIIFTADWSGLGFAKILQDEGHGVIVAYEMNPDEEKEEEYEKVGDGIVMKIPAKEIMKNKEKYREWYILFDMNKLTEYSEELREKGFKVLGASSFQTQMEDDRDFAVELHKKYGLSSPETMEFSSLEEGMSFLVQNEDRAFVFKPDGADASYMTYVPNADKPEEANRELYNYMKSLNFSGTYIIQEKIKGLEINLEAWFFDGKPFFAFCGLENKRKLNGDMGEMCGCAHDVTFTVPLESKLYKSTVGKLEPYYEEIKYTGFADVNVIIADKDNYYLESCMRFGYNAHPNLFMALCKDGVGQTIADMLDGKIENFYDKFRYGFGASISLYIDHPRTGLPIHIEKDADSKFYQFDTYGEDGNTLLAGYDHAVGIVVGHGFTLEDAGEDVMDNAKKISFPDKSMRTDICRDNYPNNPRDRYLALLAMKFI